MTTALDVMELLEARNKRLPGCSYKLGSGQYGMDLAIDGPMGIDKGRMSVVIPFADGARRDGVGDLLEVGGIRTERHIRNPVVLFDHGKKYELPIGLAEDPETKQYTVVIDPVAQKASLTCFFYQGKGINGLDKGKEFEHALFCEQLFDLIANGFVRAGSIGYQVIKALQLAPDYERGTPAGLHLVNVLMLEGSAVVMPANGDTVRKVLSMDKVCGKKLSYMLVKSLEPYAEENKVQVGYEKKADPKNQLLSAVDKLGSSMVNLADLRPASGLDRSTFDRTLQDLRRAWVLSMSAAEGRHGITQREKEAGIPDDSNPGGLLLFVSRRKGMERNGECSTEHGMPANGDKAIGDPGHDPHAFDAHHRARGSRRSEGERFPENPIDKNGRPLKIGSTVRTDSGSQGTIVSIYQNGRVVLHTGEETTMQQIVLVKSMGDKKDLEPIRKKYRSVKAVRFRRKKSSPGASAMLVREKDLHAAEEEAKAKGIGFEKSGFLNGHVRVKLSGDDTAIDGLAKRYGMPRVGGKDLEIKSIAVIEKFEYEGDDGKWYQGQSGFTNQPFSVRLTGNKRSRGFVLVDNSNGSSFGKIHSSRAEAQAIADKENIRLESWGKGIAILPRSKNKGIDSMKSMNTKALDIAEGMDSDEPLGAQILRKWHADLGNMMSEYDGYMGPLENEAVKKRMQKALEDAESAMTEIEGLFGKTYTDLPGLVANKDMEEEVEETRDDLEEAGEELEDVEREAGTETEEEPADDKDMDTMEDTANPAPSGGPADDVPVEEAAEAMHSKPEEKKEKKSLPDPLGKSRLKYRKKELPNGKVKAVCPECGKENCECKSAKAIPDEPTPAETVDQTNEVDANTPKGLEPWQRKGVGEAGGFLGEMSTTQEFGDEQRMKSYHYHKTLEGIVQLVGVSQDDLTKGMSVRTKMADLYSIVQTVTPDAGRHIRGSGYPVGSYEIDFDIDEGKARARAETYRQHAWDGVTYTVEKVGEESPKRKPPTKSMPKHLKADPGTEDRQKVLVVGREIQIDKSGQGHNWRNTDYIPANIIEEIEGEIIDGKQESHNNFVASNGQHYRWQRKMQEPEHKTGNFQAINDASGFLKNLSQERAFGDPHREEAARHAKALEPFGKEDEPKKEDEQVPEPGETGTKQQEVKSISAKFDATAELLERLNKRMQSIGVLN